MTDPTPFPVADRVAVLSGREDAIVGVIANPVSARDIRRVIANAGNLQLVDRANMVLRALAGLGACGIPQVWMMPDRDGLGALVRRSFERERLLADDEAAWPALSWLDMPVTGHLEDTLRAASMLREMGAAAVVVLGGDGTHRAVVAECGQVPIAGLSTGTNNAYPETRESTSVGMAVGLYVSGRIPRQHAVITNKCLAVGVARGGREVQRDIALVDVAVLRDSFLGAGAMWRADALAALYLSFAEPDAIGLASIGGLLNPVGRHAASGLHVELTSRAEGMPAPRFWLHAAIAPGRVRRVGVLDWWPLVRGKAMRVRQREGAIALDGERALSFTERDTVTVTLHTNAFRSIDVDACLAYAAAHGILRDPCAAGPRPTSAHTTT